MWIAGLHTYPVKGCRGLDHDAAVVEVWGLAGDRRWMMVDAEGVGITQRETARLTQLTALPRPGGVTLSAPGMPELDVAEPRDGRTEFVRVFRSHPHVPARVAETRWSSAFLGRDARLVWQADPTGRPIKSPAFAGDRVSLADGFPVLLASTASLDAVSRKWPPRPPNSSGSATRYR